MGTVVLVALGTGGWLAFGQHGYPFRDARACEGSDVPLQQMIDVTGLPLPKGARDVHYVTDRGATGSDPELAIAFRSTRTAMKAYLRAHRIVASGLDRLDDGRFGVGDVGPDPKSVGLCGHVPQIVAPGVAVVARLDEVVDSGTEIVEVDLQTEPLDHDLIRATTEVVLRVYEGPRT